MVNSVILYGALVWEKIALRISSAYRTISTKVVQVVAGTILIHLQIQERSYEKDTNKQEQKMTTRDRTIEKWQQEWDVEATTMDKETDLS